jgi:hypothetical protein
MLKIKQTKRKFYNKWLYKITLKIPGIACLRNGTFVDIQAFLTTGQGQTVRISTPYLTNMRLYDVSILKLIGNLQLVDTSQYSKRIEGHNIDIYTNNSLLFDKLSIEFENETVHRFQPHHKLTELSDGSTVIVRQLPYNQYHYKVYLLPHIFKNDIEKKLQLLDYLEKQKNKILISNIVKDWVIRTNWNWDRRYIYVKDESTLLMLKLRDADVIGKVYKYILIDK